LDFSVTITTFNRAESLRRSLEALHRQDYPLDAVEIIVADNGSTDHTKSVADVYAEQFANFRYLFDARPGQLVGWHRAFEIATGVVTCFIDDDVRPDPGWLTALGEAYRDPRAGLATGPIRLTYDAIPPDWLALMTLGDLGAETIPFLGGLEAGPSLRAIPGNFVWGSNFSVRRTVLAEVGGFHPCAMPWDLIRFYGDGEIHIGRTAETRGHRILYHPGASVRHDIPAGRLTLEAVMRKFTTTGCARSFQAMRASGGPIAAPSAEEIRTIARRYFRDANAAPGDLVKAVEIGLDHGMTIQRDAVRTDPAFRDWVLRENYLDLDACYRHPDLAARIPAGSTSKPAVTDWRSGV
jgi:glycosyltransferase involved in cell wall biosynthesis